MPRNRSVKTIASTVARFARKRYARIERAPTLVAARVAGTRRATETCGYGTVEIISTEAAIVARRTTTFALNTAGVLSEEAPKSSTREITRRAFAGVGNPRNDSFAWSICTNRARRSIPNVASQVDATTARAFIGSAHALPRVRS